jgi:hypothetical protein
VNKDLQSYVKVYNNWFDDTLCDQSITEFSNATWEQHQFYNPISKSSSPRSGDKELDMTFDDISTYDEIMNMYGVGFAKYLQELNFPWYDHWSGFSPVRYNRYLETRLMAEHCDHIHTIFDGDRKGIPTLSALAVLNDDYTGGEFVMWTDTVIPLKKGDLLVFPSNFLYPHRVEPVTSGVRYSAVTWAF